MTCFSCTSLQVRIVIGSIILMLMCLYGGVRYSSLNQSTLTATAARTNSQALKDQSPTRSSLSTVAVHSHKSSTSTVAVHTTSSDITKHSPWKGCFQSISAKDFDNYDPSTDKLICYGRIKGGEKYAMYSATLETNGFTNYFYPLPITAKTWNRIGFKSMVVLVGDIANLSNKTKELSSYVISALLDEHAVVILLQVPLKAAITLSQVARMFLASLIDPQLVENPEQWLETYLITSDADLWPITSGTNYQPPAGTEILSLNSFCCGKVQHKGKSYQHIPMANVGMKVSKWLSVLERDGLTPRTPDDIVLYITREFGQIANKTVKGGTEWYIDQKMISVLLQTWADKGNNSKLLKKQARSVWTDRVDRSSWRPTTIVDKFDAHIIEFGFRETQWPKLEQLLVMMFNEKEVQWCKHYSETFRKLVE